MILSTIIQNLILRIAPAWLETKYIHSDEKTDNRFIDFPQFEY